MTRRNIQVERLEFENKHLREQIARMREEPPDSPVTGCGDGSCLVATPKGMHTNGGCRCDERTLRRAVMYLNRRCDYLQATIQEMRDGKPEETYRDFAERFIKEAP